MKYQTMCALRIYLRRGDTTEPTSFWRRLFRKPLTGHLVQQALRGGVAHASVTYGHVGFARGATTISMDTSEIPVDALPACVELVAPRPILDAFVREHAPELGTATLVMLEGVHVRSHLVEERDPASRQVEYIRIGSAALAPEEREQQPALPAG